MWTASLVSLGAAIITPGIITKAALLGVAIVSYAGYATVCAVEVVRDDKEDYIDITDIEIEEADKDVDLYENIDDKIQ